MKLAVLYAAKSTVDKLSSIPDQLDDCRKLAAERELEITSDREFSDEDKSAYHRNRGDGLRKAMAECERIAPCALIVQRSDRLARGDAVKAQHLSEVVLWAIKHDVTLISVLDPAAFPHGAGADPNMKLILGGIAGMSGNQESEKRGQSVKKDSGVGWSNAASTSVVDARSGIATKRGSTTGESVSRGLCPTTPRPRSSAGFSLSMWPAEHKAQSPKPSSARVCLRSRQLERGTRPQSLACSRIRSTSAWPPTTATTTLPITKPLSTPPRGAGRMNSVRRDTRRDAREDDARRAGTY